MRCCARQSLGATIRLRVPGLALKPAYPAGLCSLLACYQQVHHCQPRPCTCLHTMDASRPQATQAGPDQSGATCSQHFRESLQPAESSTQHSSHVSANPTVQATQTFFYPAPAPAAAAAPAPVVQGFTVGAINTTQPLYCPAQQVICCLQIAFPVS